MCSCWFGVLICTHTGDRLSLIWKKKNHQKLPPNVYILDLLHTCSCRIQSKKTHLNKEQTRACKASHLLEFFLCVGITQATNAQKKKEKKCCHQSSEYAHLFTGYILQMSARRIAYFYHNQSESLLNDWKCHLSSHWTITSFRKGPGFFIQLKR